MIKMYEIHDQSYFDEIRKKIENYCYDLYINNNAENYIKIYNLIPDDVLNYIALTQGLNSDILYGKDITPWNWIKEENKLNQFCHDLIMYDDYNIDYTSMTVSGGQELLSNIPIDIIYARAKSIIETKFKNITSNDLLKKLEYDRNNYISYALIFDQKAQPLIPILSSGSDKIRVNRDVYDRIEKFSSLISMEDEEFVRKFYMLFTIGSIGESYLYDDINTFERIPADVSLLSDKDTPKKWNDAIKWAWNVRKKLANCWAADCSDYSNQPQ